MSRASTYSSSTYCASLTQEKRCNHDIGYSHPRSYDHWDHLFELVNKTDENTYEQRRESLERQYQTALFCAGSLATVILDSYKWLTDNPTHSFIAKWISLAFPRDPTHDHKAQGRFPATTGHFLPFRTASIINTLWFLSLILMCFVLLVCSLSLRCLREFRNFPQFEAKHLLAFRQMRYNGLRRCKVFAICNAVHLILPLAIALFFSGLILLLRILDQLDSSVVSGAFGFIALYFLYTVFHPLFCSLLKRDTTSSRFFLFMSPSSWLLFKMGHHLISVTIKLVDPRKGPKQTKSPISPHKPEPYLRDISRRALESEDWLEYSCSTFLQPQNAKTIDVLVADALIWVDSNPKIEKSKRLVFSIYWCILDLTSPDVFTELNYTPQVLRSRLAKVFYETGHTLRYNGYQARVRASKLWLAEMCAEQPPPNRNEPLYYSKCLYGDTSNALQLKDCPPLEVVLQRLETAKKHLACGTYYSGTFNIIYELMIKRTDPIVDLRIQELTASVFYEFGEFIRRFTSRDERCLPEVKSYAKELEGFVHNVNEMANGMRGSLRGSWSRVISDAGSLLFNVERLLSSQPFDGPGAGSSGSMVVAATRNKERYSFDAV